MPLSKIVKNSFLEKWKGVGVRRAAVTCIPSYTACSQKYSQPQWRNDGVAAASSDGGTLVGGRWGPRQREKRPEGARPEKVTGTRMVALHHC